MPAFLHKHCAGSYISAKFEPDKSMYRSAKATDHSVKFGLFTIDILKPRTVLLEELLTAK